MNSHTQTINDNVMKATELLWKFMINNAVKELVNAMRFTSTDSVLVLNVDRVKKIRKAEISGNH